MVDVVVNHMAADAVPPNYSALQPFDEVNDFHPFCFISDYNNQTDVEQCWLGDNNVPLPDLDTEDDTIVSTMNNWIKGLVSNYSVDGLRIDTVKHIRKDFWPDFASSAGVFTLGEVLIGDVSYVAPYTRKSMLAVAATSTHRIVQRSSIAPLTIPPTILCSGLCGVFPFS